MSRSDLKLAFNLCALLVALALGFVLCLSPVKGGTVWSWASMGEVLAREGGFPRFEPGMAAPGGSLAFEHQGWLFGLLAYGLASLKQQVSLGLLKAVLMVAAFAFCVATGFRSRARPFSCAVFALAGLWASRSYFTDGPMLAGYACFSAALFMMEGEFWPAFFRRWVWLPLLAVAWLNLHLSALLLLPVALAWMLGERGDPREAPAVPLFSKALYLALLAGCFLLNPDGWRVFAEPLALAGREARWLYGWSSPLAANSFHDARPALLLMALALPLILAGTWMEEGRERLGRDILLFGLLASLALLSQALIPFFCLWLAPVAATRATLLVDSLPGWLKASRWPFKLALLALAVLALPRAWSSPDFGFGTRLGDAPSQTLDLMREQGLSGVVFAPIEWSGWLQWQMKDQARLLVAPRAFDPGNARDYLEAMEAKPAVWPQVFERYGVGLALLAPGSPLAVALSYSQDWQPVAFDDASVLFAKAGPEHADLIKTFAPRGLKPGDPARAIDPSRLGQTEADLEALAGRMAGVGRYHYYRALLFQAEDEQDKVRQALEDGKSADPGFALNAQWLDYLAQH
jgi:hypothetical protein